MQHHAHVGSSAPAKLAASTDTSEQHQACALGVFAVLSYFHFSFFIYFIFHFFMFPCAPCNLCVMHHVRGSDHDRQLPPLRHMYHGKCLFPACLCCLVQACLALPGCQPRRAEFQQASASTTPGPKRAQRCFGQAGYVPGSILLFITPPARRFVATTVYLIINRRLLAIEVNRNLAISLLDMQLR
jgi:hypothetical protein